MPYNHHVSLSQRHCKVSHTSRTVGIIDPVVTTETQYIRKDGAVFAITECWGVWRMSTNGKQDQAAVREKDLELWLKSHSLPSLQWLEDRLHSLANPNDEEPNFCPANYI